MTFDNKISIILPTLNEEKNLKILVPEISSLFENDLKLEYEIIADTKNKEIYNKGYKLFRDLYENTKDLMKRIDS